MNMNQYPMHTLMIEIISVLLSSIISFGVCKMFELRLIYFPLIVVGCYIVLKILYSLSLMVAGYIVKLLPIKATVASTLPDKKGTINKRAELLHQQIQHEQYQYDLEKEKEEDAKLYDVLKYTQETFSELGFNDMEILQICESVRYFVTNREPLTKTEIYIRRRFEISQVSLKNFSWNIACQYNINGDATAAFVKNTFYEWFSNTSLSSIKKNLRTVAGRHKIEIDENICR